MGAYYSHALLQSFVDGTFGQEGRMKLMSANFASSLNSIGLMIFGFRVLTFLLNISNMASSVKIGGSVKLM